MLKTSNIQHYEELGVNFMNSFFNCWEHLGVKLFGGYSIKS